MIQRYHTILRPQPHGWFVGWVEEIPGTITYGQSLDHCRANLREALKLMVETHRDEARLALDPSCILEPIEIEVCDDDDDVQGATTSTTAAAPAQTVAGAPRYA